MTPFLVVEALEECEIALEKPEHWFFACTLLSNVLADLGEVQGAQLWSTLARQTQLSRQTFHILAGTVYAQLESWKEAIQHNQKALALDRKLAIAYSNIAQFYQRVGKSELSAEYLYRFMVLRPEQPPAETCEDLGTTLLGRGQIDRALDCYRWAIKNNPRCWTAYYRAAHLLTLTGQPDRAMRYYRLLLERDPSQAEGKHKLGMLLLEQKKLDEAIEQFRGAIAQDPAFKWSYLGLAKALTAQGCWDEVIATCRVVLRLIGEEPWAYHHLVRALIQQGQESEVIPYLQKLCVSHGWSNCVEKDYQFNRDLLTHKIALWSQQLGAWQDLPARTAPLRVLQIGGFQGMWSCWMLDHILNQPGDELLCIDRQISPQLKLNLEKAPATATVAYHRGAPASLLPQLHPPGSAAYDLIYLQDRSPTATRCRENALLCWPLLQEGGLMVFRDYNKSAKSAQPAQSPQMAPSADAGPEPQAPRAGIQHFLRDIQDQFVILDESQFLFIQKSVPDGDRL